jgi:hypothetical protein
VNAVACAAELQRGIRKQNAGAPKWFWSLKFGTPFNV